MEYLYSHTGKALTPVFQNPVEEARLVEEIYDDDIQDEGFEEETTEDITVPVLHEDDPSRQLPSSLMEIPQASPPQAPASPDDLPSRSCDGGQQPAAAPSVLPDTSQAALDSETNLSDEAQVSHINGYFKLNSITFYFPFTIATNQYIYYGAVIGPKGLGGTKSWTSLLTCWFSVRHLTSLNSR